MTKEVRKAHLMLSARASGGGCRPSGQTQSSCAQLQTRGRGSPLSAAALAPRHVPGGIGPGDSKRVVYSWFHRSLWCDRQPDCPSLRDGRQKLHEKFV